jgi:hypothetical protein
MWLQPSSGEFPLSFGVVALEVEHAHAETLHRTKQAARPTAVRRAGTYSYAGKQYTYKHAADPDFDVCADVGFSSLNTTASCGVKQQVRGVAWRVERLVVDWTARRAGVSHACTDQPTPGARSGVSGRPAGRRGRASRSAARVSRRQPGQRGSGASCATAAAPADASRHGVSPARAETGVCRPLGSIRRRSAHLRARGAATG